MNLRGKRVTVVGLGRTALAAVRLLLREGAEPFVTESRDDAKLQPFKEALRATGVAFECGGHTPRATENAFAVIPSPGVPPALPLIAQAKQSGALVLSELELAFPFCRPKIIAVTGTNGKTTTTELLRSLVAACGYRVALAGNNEMPFSDAVLLDPAPEMVVLEVSSYQLELVQTFRPWIASVLNVTPDHLARHGSVDAYAAVKARIFEKQHSGDSAVFNYDDPRVAAMACRTRSIKWSFSINNRLHAGFWVSKAGTIFFGDEPMAHHTDTQLKGRHNLSNVLAALTCMYAGGFAWDDVLKGLRSFRGVEHRIEYVAVLDGVKYYNDSKSTNIDSLRVALESFEEPVVLIAGGEGKGADYGVLTDLVRERVKHLVLIGADAFQMEKAFGAAVSLTHAGSMDEAVRKAAAAASAGDSVLLSPACASFDMFENFEHRGRVFKECVARMQRLGVAS
ncbi:MAG: UDP-N-acetylmuramoylalanine--D-glutamate ligase [Candidatus Hydrogenedentota bacterium]